MFEAQQTDLTIPNTTLFLFRNTLSNFLSYQIQAVLAILAKQYTSYNF